MGDVALGTNRSISMIRITIGIQEFFKTDFFHFSAVMPTYGFCGISGFDGGLCSPSSVQFSSPD